MVSPQSFKHFDAGHFHHLLQNSLIIFLFAFQFTAAVTVLNAHFQIYWKVSQQNIVTLLPHLSLIQTNFYNSRLKKNERQTT